MLTMRKTLLTALAVLCLGTLARAEAKVDPLVPADSEQVATMDIKQMLASPMVKPQVPAMKMMLAGNKEVMQVLNAIGLDPFKDLDSITLSNKGQTGEDLLLVIRGSFQEDKIHDTLAKVAKSEPEKVAMSKVGDLRVYEFSGDQTLYAAFADNKTVVASLSKDRTAKQAKAGKAGGKLNKGLADAVSTLSGKESMWLATVVTDDMKRAMAANPQAAALAPKLKALTVGVTLMADASLMQAEVHTTDAKAAAQVEKVVKQVLPLLQLIAQGNEEVGPILTELLDNLKISTEKSRVVLSLKVTKELMEKAQKAGGGDF